MNKTYRLIWSELARSWIAVAETARTHGKRASGALLLAASGLALAAPPLPNQLPSGGQIAAGSGSIAVSGNAMTVTQTSQRMVANWNSFDIGSQASVNFVQPSASSIALNRVLSQDPTQILGRLSANGQVMLMNPAGIVFGQGSQVNVGALVASTLAISDASFMTGDYRFANAGGAGSVINQGRIVTPNGGVVAFLAPVIKNQGDIETPKGSTLFAAAAQVTVDFQGDGLITYSLDAGTAGALIENSGNITADGGMAVLTAKAADAVTRAVVSNDGIIRARTLESRGGRIILDAGTGPAGGTAEVTGTLDATATSGTGGRIDVLGEHVGLLDNARLDASGSAGGGTVQVGGSWQNSDPAVPQATSTYVAPTAVLKASATDRGDGGTMVAWSDISNPQSSTRAFGTFEAKGGPNGGDGGRIETSGHQLSVTDIRASTAAPSGKPGTWLLDPGDIIIAAAGASGTTWGAPDNGYAGGTYTPGAASTILASDIVSALGSSNVTVTTGSGSYDLTVNSAISWNSANSLTLSAGRHLTTNANIANAGNGGVTLLAAQNAAGLLTVNNGITTTGGAINLYANRNASGTDLNSQYGSIYLNNALASNGGNVAIKNGARGATSANIFEIGGSGSIQAGAGNISIAGYATGQNQWNVGVTVRPGATIQTSGGGTVTIVGDSLGTSCVPAVQCVSANGGIYLGNTASAGTITISSVNGDIALTGSKTFQGGWHTGIGVDGTQAQIVKVYSTAGNISLNATTDAGTASTYFPNGTVYIGYDGGGASVGTSGNIGISASGLGLDLTTVKVKSNGGVVTIGDNGSALASLTLPNGSIVASGSYKTFTIGGTNTGDVTIDTNLTTNNATNDTLTVTSKGSVVLAANRSISAAANPLNVVLRADSDANSGGAIHLKGTASILTNGGHIWMGGGSGTAVWNGLTVGDGYAVGITNTPADINTGSNWDIAGIYLGTGGSVASGGGNIALFGKSFNGTTIAKYYFGTYQDSTNSLDAGAGSILIDGRAQGTLGNAQAVVLQGSIASTSPLPGAISITGVNNSTTTDSAIGFNLLGTIQATNGGEITINGTGGGTAGTGWGGVLGGNILANGGPITITGQAVQGGQPDLYVRDTTYANTIGYKGGTSVTASSSLITLNADTVTFGDTSARWQSSGALIFQPRTGGTTVGIAGGAGTLQLPATLFSTILTNGFSNITIGSPFTGAITLGALTINNPLALMGSGLTVSGNIGGTSTFLATVGGNVTINNPIALTGPASTIRIEAQGGITLGSTLSASGTGYALVLNGASFTNNAGAGALSTPAGNWQVWSGNPAGDNRGGLAYNFKQYNATYGVSAVLGTGNGFLYTLAPTLTVSLVGLGKTYDGNTNVTLAAGNYSYTGSAAVDGDATAWTPSGGTAAYDSANAGSRTVTVTGASFNTTNGAATVYGYLPVANPTGTGTITPATLTVTADAKSKVYGAVDPALTYIYSGFVGADTAALLSGALVRAAGANVGTYAITQNTLTAGSNYSIAYTGANLTITPAALTVAADAKSKIYGAADPTLTYIYSGLVNGDTAAILSGALVRAAGANVGTYAITQNTLTAGSNYSITYTGANLTIGPKPLAVTGTTAANKFYDGNTDATLTLGTLGGLVGGETLVLAATGAFDTPTAGRGKTVTLAYALANGIGLASNYSLANATTTADITTPVFVPPPTAATPPPAPASSDTSLAPPPLTTAGGGMSGSLPPPPAPAAPPDSGGEGGGSSDTGSAPAAPKPAAKPPAGGNADGKGTAPAPANSAAKPAASPGASGKNTAPTATGAGAVSSITARLAGAVTSGNVVPVGKAEFFAKPLVGPGKSRVTLLPQADGKPSAVVVFSEQGTVVLDKPFAVVGAESSGQMMFGETDASAVRNLVGATLDAQPAKPVSLVLRFVSGTNELTAESKAALQKLSAELGDRPLPEVEVVGHADRRGSARANNAIALTRARAVRSALIAAGIAPRNIETSGRGANQPLDPSSGKAADAANRRVELTIR